MLLVTARRPAVTLTPREHQIVELLRRGFTAKEIAGRLGLSVWTIRSHIERARDRTDTRTTAQLVGVLTRARDARRTS